MIEIKLKGETPAEAAMYLEAPMVRGALDSFAYWLRNQIKNGNPENTEILEQVQKEFYENLGEML